VALPHWRKWVHLLPIVLSRRDGVLMRFGWGWRLTYLGDWLVAHAFVLSVSYAAGGGRRGVVRAPVRAAALAGHAAAALRQPLAYLWIADGWRRRQWEEERAGGEQCRAVGRGDGERRR